VRALTSNFESWGLAGGIVGCPSLAIQGKPTANSQVSGGSAAKLVGIPMNLHRLARSVTAFSYPSWLSIDGNFAIISQSVRNTP
jgi:hypothetical protein